MPFTLAHTVAAIPLRRPLGRRAVWSALVIGTMAPDFHYFFPWGPTRIESHSPAGLLVFALPAGLAAYLLFHLLVAPLVWALAPDRVRAKLDPAAWRARLPAAGPAAVVLSILAGGVTHLVWDAFTHPGAATGWWPALATPLFSAAGYTAHVYSVLQLLSTALGCLILWRRWRARPLRTVPAAAGVRPARVLQRVLLAALIVAPTVAVGLHAGLAHADTAPGGLWAVRRFIWHGMAGAVRTGSVALLLAALFMRLTAASPARVPPKTS